MKLRKIRQRMRCEFLLRKLKHLGQLKKSEAIAENYLQKAIAILAEFPPSKELKPLKQIVQFLDKRKY